MLKTMFVALTLLASALLSADATYYVGFLRPDPTRKALPKDQAERIQGAHMANIQKMADDGQLAAAGPFDDTTPTISGIFVFKTRSLEEARRVATEDPTVVEHRNTIDVHPWHGPVGIGDEYFRLHKDMPKTVTNMGVHPLFLMQRGPHWESKEHPAIMEAHRTYWSGLHSKLGAAGAVESTDLKGIVIFKRIPFDEAQALIDSDPAVRAGIFTPEGHHWWCADHVLPR
jgi:uncharacterized protein YciI